MEDLKSVSLKLKTLFSLLVILPVLYIGLSEYGVIHIVFSISSPAVQYNYEIGCILATLAVVPASLKMFRKLFDKKVEGEVSLVKALKRYFWLSVIRLLALFVVAMYNVVLYYSVENSNIGILCFFICIVAYMFCIPSKSRIEQDLHLEKL